MRAWIWIGVALANLSENRAHGLVMGLAQLRKAGDGWEDILGEFKDEPAHLLENPLPPVHIHGDEVMANLRKSFISVCPAKTILKKRCICARKYEDISIVKGSSMDSIALVAAEPAARQIIVSYRPTITLKNWITDADYRLIQLKDAPAGVMVHHGFHEYLQDIQPGTLEAARKLLADPRYSSYRLHVTGYSLGAAIATISAASWGDFLIQTNYHHPLEVFAYSGPRPGNAKFADYVSHLEIVRYSNHNDLVPHLPPRSLGFTHAGLEFHYKDSALKVCSSRYDEDPTCSLNVKSPLSFVRHYFPDGKPIPTPPYC